MWKYIKGYCLSGVLGWDKCGLRSKACWKDEQLSKASPLGAFRPLSLIYGIFTCWKLSGELVNEEVTMIPALRYLFVPHAPAPPWIKLNCESTFFKMWSLLNRILSPWSSLVFSRFFCKWRLSSPTASDSNLMLPKMNKGCGSLNLFFHGAVNRGYTLFCRVSLPHILNSHLTCSATQS